MRKDVLFSVPSKLQMKCHHHLSACPPPSEMGQPIKAAAFMLTKCLKKRAFTILLHFGSGSLVLLVLAVVGGGIYKGVLDIKNIVLR